MVDSMMVSMKAKGRTWGIRFLIFTLLLAGCTASPAQIPVSNDSQLPDTGATETALPTVTPAVEPEASGTPADGAGAVAEPANGTPALETVPAAVACSSPADLTPALTEGPYYTPGSPQRTSLLEQDMPGIKLTLTGYVLTPDCQPVANAWLDFWQADAQGQYDNAGYTLRGHQFTGPDGRYQLETVVPGFYSGRTEHIHVKVQAPDGPVLTTQLFFPGVTDNEQDRIFDRALLVQVQGEDGESMQATFNFIVTP